MVKCRRPFAPRLQVRYRPAPSSILPDPSSITPDPSAIPPSLSGRAIIFPIIERHHTAHYIDIAFYRVYGAR